MTLLHFSSRTLAGLAVLIAVALIVALPIPSARAAAGDPPTLDGSRAPSTSALLAEDVPAPFSFTPLSLSVTVPRYETGTATLTIGNESGNPMFWALDYAAVFSEQFDDVTTLPAAGWAVVNHSNPIGSTAPWFQGNSSVFPAYAGASDSYVAANYNAAGDGTLSAWLITPVLTNHPGDYLTFWTRSSGPTYPDRLEVRRSPFDSLDVGTAATDVGSFNILLASINPSLAQGGYPTSWTRYGLPLNLASPQTGRLAFRYYVTNAGPAGINSDYIGIDSVVVHRPVSWLALSTQSGQLAASQSVPVTVTFDTAGLLPGIYTTQLLVTEGATTTTVPVTLTILPAANRLFLPFTSR